MHQHKFIPQLFFRLDMLRILHNSIGDRAHLLAGWCLVVPYAFGTLIAVNLLDMIAH